MEDKQEREIDDDPSQDKDEKAPSSVGGLAFRRGLLNTMPRLVYRGWSVKEATQFDQNEDIQSLIDLDADEFLEPLRTLLGVRRST